MKPVGNPAIALPVPPALTAAVAQAFDVPPDRVSRRDFAGQFLDEAATAKDDDRALRFLCYVLPPREAVWWGCLALRALGPLTVAALGERRFAAVRAAASWAILPDDVKRRAAKDAAEAAGAATPEGCLAMAAGYNGGSVLPPELPPVPPPELFPKVLVGALLIAAARDPSFVTQTKRRFVEIGLEFARGNTLWPTPTATPKPPLHGSNRR